MTILYLYQLRKFRLLFGAAKIRLGKPSVKTLLKIGRDFVHVLKKIIVTYVPTLNYKKSAVLNSPYFLLVVLWKKIFSTQRKKAPSLNLELHNYLFRFITCALLLARLMLSRGEN